MRASGFGLPVPEEQEFLPQHRHSIKGRAGITEVREDGFMRRDVGHGGFSQEGFPRS